MGWWKKRIYFLSCISRLISCNFLSQTFESRTVGKYTFPGCWKTLLKPKTLGMQLAQIGSERIFDKSVSSSPCVWFHLCLAFREWLFLKLILKYWWIFLTCFQHWHRHAKPFLTPRKKKLHSYQISLTRVKMTVVKFKIQ